ncbi:MAG: DUF2892 domain-containing protein [Chloroflexi bacterium]|nr:DUF2892 domain-containing protein [Chloroflexota bacterium]
MTSMAGRVARVVLGLLILSLGLFVVRGTVGIILTIVSFVPMVGGVFNFCVAGFAMGYPFKGSEARAELEGK